MERFLKLNVASDLVGMPVFALGSSQDLGVVTDALINLRDGRLLGLALRTQNGSERVVLSRHLEVDAQRVSINNGETAADGRDDGAADGRDDGAADGIRALRELRGANVVTDEGQLLGRVREIQVSPSDGRVVYGIGEMPLLQRLFGHGLVIEGSVGCSYSRAGSRLIVHIPHKSSEVSGRQSDGRKKRIGWRRTERVVHTFLTRYGFMIWLAILIAVLLVLLLWL